MPAVTLQKKQSLLDSAQIEATFDGLKLDLERVKKYVDRDYHDEMLLTDFVCRLNAFIKELQNEVDEGKGLIKDHLTHQKKTISEGYHYIAVLQESEVNRLNTEKVKAFLGKKLKDFTNTSTETKLIFKPKV